jgi:hypothetical protein
MEPMEFFQTVIRFARENFLFNPLFWGIAAVVLWIVGSAFLKAWRGKNEEDNGEV